MAEPPEIAGAQPTQVVGAVEDSPAHCPAVGSLVPAEVAEVAEPVEGNATAWLAVLRRQMARQRGRAQGTSESDKEASRGKRSACTDQVLRAEILLPRTVVHLVMVARQPERWPWQ